MSRSLPTGMPSRKRGSRWALVVLAILVAYPAFARPQFQLIELEPNVSLSSLLLSGDGRRVAGTLRRFGAVLETLDNGEERWLELSELAP